MPSITLTSDLIGQLACPPAQGKQDWHDMQCKGLMLEVRASGGKTFYLRYRNFRGKQRQLRIADARDLSLAAVRRQADQLRAQVALGQDPADLMRGSKQLPTLAEFVDKQYLPYIRGYKRSWQTDWSLLRNHLLPQLGSRPLDEITRNDVVQLHQSRLAAGAKPGSANRVLITLRYIYNLAIKWEVPGVKVNPCKGVPLMEENNKRERYLSVQEAQRLYECVHKSENTMLRYIVPMLILTGARKREVLDARWADFDLARRIWRIPISKSGKARHVPLSDGAIALLATVPRLPECEWTFANPDTAKPYVSVFYAWSTARKNAGLADVRMHDLRHSFASLLINSGRTLYEVQHILGHTQVRTTQRYAHLSQDTLLAAANAATEAVGAVLLLR